MRGRLSDCGGERAIHGCNPFAVSNALASLEGVCERLRLGETSAAGSVAAYRDNLYVVGGPAART